MYGFTTTLTGITFDQALAKTLAALKAEGFGVLSDIDVQHPCAIASRGYRFVARQSLCRDRIGEVGQRLLQPG